MKTEERLLIQEKGKAGYLTITPQARVVYDMIDSQRGAWRRVGYNHLISSKREWNNCFTKNKQEILLISLCKNSQKTI